MMRKPIGLCALFLVLAAAPALADWDHPVKWDQLQPGPFSLVSCTGATEEHLTADDFLCSETGWITGIVFGGTVALDWDNLTSFRVTFWNDVPATLEEESHPGVLHTEILVDPADPLDPLSLGWKYIGDWTLRINLPEDDWFEQEEGSIYWIGIQGVMNNGDFFSWKAQDLDAGTWGDDAAYNTPPELDLWQHWGWVTSENVQVYEGTLPGDWLQSADMSFRLSGIPIPEPSTLLLAGLGLLTLWRRRK